MFEAVSFPGGGNRCYWQGGFWEVAAPALDFAPARVIGVSGGAFAAAYSLLGLGAKVRERALERCRSGVPNFDWRRLRSGGAFPVASLYQELLVDVLDADAFAAINAKTDLRVAIARPPRGLPGSLAALLGLVTYSLEKKLFAPVHPSWGRRLGFRDAAFSVRALPHARAWADVTFASACVPPIIRLQTIDGQPALDGGMADNVPVEPLREIEAQGGRTLVLLTRRYKKTPTVTNRLYVQPSEKIEVRQFDITSPEGIQHAYELGLRDGEAFVRTMRNGDARLN